MSLAGKDPGVYANGCNFCANTIVYAKFGNGFVQHAYFLSNLRYTNKLPQHMSHGYIHTWPPCKLLILWLKVIFTYSKIEGGW